jgi:hypothetical protein
LLLERRKEANERPSLVTTTQTIRFGEELKLPADGDLTVLAAKFLPMLGGRLFGYLYHPPPVWITLTTSDGRKWHYRYVPSMGETGWLISPLVTGTQSLLTCYGARKPVRVESIQFETAQPGWDAYEDTVDITISSRPRPVLSPDKSSQILEH